MEVLILNRRSSYDYEILEKFVAGIKLQGHEVKSLKNKNGKILGSYVIERNEGFFWVNGYIEPWKNASKQSLIGYKSDRDRKLLLTRKQMQEISLKKKQQKATIVPTAILLDKRYIKLEIALVKALRKYDKVAKKKERDEKRKIQRMVKECNKE